LIAINATGVAPSQASTAAGSMGSRTEPTPKQSSVTFFMMSSPVPLAVAAVQIEGSLDAEPRRFGVSAL